MFYLYSGGGSMLPPQDLTQRSALEHTLWVYDEHVTTHTLKAGHLLQRLSNVVYGGGEVAESVTDQVFTRIRE